MRHSNRHHHQHHQQHQHHQHHHRFLAVLLAGFLFLSILPTRGETDGKQRQILEGLDYSERMIQAGIYARSRHDVFHKNKREYIHGLKRTNLPYIYEPDVYTWELAMAAHRQQVFNDPPLMTPLPDYLSPEPMAAPGMFPGDPGQIQLTPLGPQTYMSSRPLPDNAEATMRRLQLRASGIGLTPAAPLRADAIKQRLIQHMNSLGQQPMVPMVPVLPRAYPRGTAADSYDPSFDQSY